MKILLANPRGFCAGVNMAIESLDLALRALGAPLYVYHEIVHNRPVVDDFRSRGAVFVSTIQEVPEGANLMFSAHGVSPEIRRQARQRRLSTIDATCPLVAKVHLEAIRFAKEGYQIVLIGHLGHDEVEGTVGEAASAITVVQSVDEVDQLRVADGTRLAWLTQTTLSVDDTARIIDRLKSRFPAIVGPATTDICYATLNRQSAVRQLAPEADVVLVVGSANSSNSQRLREIGRECGLPSYLIDGVEELDQAWFHPDQTVLLTAGASAPETVVQQCIAFLEQNFQAQVESRTVCEEEVRFPLPRELRNLQSQ